MGTVGFPDLGLEFKVNPVVFKIGNFSLRWYGLIIAVGFILAVIYIMKRAKEFNTSSDELTDLLLWGVPLSIIGARAYFVINSWDSYKNDIKEIFYIWHGGLAIYGGVIVAFLVVFFFCKKRKSDMLSIFDLIALGFLIGQFIGRWGNFVNMEAYGTATSLPWGMSINGAAPVHPTFLYESLWNLIGFIILHFYSKKRKFRGEIFLCYIAWYGFGRMLIEGLRTDSLYLGSTDIRISQLLAAVSMVIALAALFIIRVSKSYKPIKHDTVQEEEEKK